MSVIGSGAPHFRTLWASVCLAGVLSCFSSHDNARGVCSDSACAAESPPLDFATGKGKYTAHLRVVDSAGRPVEGASIKLLERSRKTDKRGYVSFDDVGASRPVPLKVSHSASAPQLATTDAFRSGQTTQQLRLSGLEVVTKLALSGPVTLQKDFVHLRMEPGSIAAPDGKRVAEANVELADLLGRKGGRRAWLEGVKAVTNAGKVTAPPRIYGAVHVRFTTKGGEALNLAGAKSATLALALSSDAKSEIGTKLGMWSLDEKSFRLKAEGSCSVVAGKGGGGADKKFCVGSVSHFSVWAVGDLPSDEADASLSCLRVRPSVADGACFSVEVERILVTSCDADGAGCTGDTQIDAVLSAGSANLPSYCGLFAEAASKRVFVLYHLRAEGCTDTAAPESGRYLKEAGLVTPETLGDSGAQILAELEGDPAALCQQTCTDVPVILGEGDLGQGPLRDADRDGYYGFSGQDEARFAGVPADCDDDDDTAYPAATELVCDDIDRDCDGETSAVERPDDKVAAQWNAECALCRERLALSDEVSGNDLDEDCDGSAEDRDGDGVDAPLDCDDDNADVYPGAAELAGNASDEDCDGVALDWDGDGMPSIRHYALADTSSFDVSAFVDCDDFDPAVGACDWSVPEAGCGAFPYDGASVPTACEEAESAGAGIGVGVCAFQGWWDGEPVGHEPGTLWGPCDGAQRLPVCPPDAQCGGPLPYSEALLDYLQSRYAGGAELGFLGMCFPKCLLP